MKKKLQGLLIVGLSLASCRQPAPKDRPVHDQQEFRAGIRYARGFTIDYFAHYKLVRVLNPLAMTTDTLLYLLVPHGAPVPSGYPGAQVIRTPVRSIICTYSIHIAEVDFAGVADLITGLGDLRYVSSPEVRKNIGEGKVKGVGLDATVNNELVFSMHPDLFIASGAPGAGTGKYKTLIDAGIPVLLNTDWLEADPLGRAEWVRLMGALTDRESVVDKKFDSVAAAYQRLAQLGRRATDRPHVIIGLPYKGSWAVPAGGSYMAQFLRDAGAGYKWMDTPGTGSMELNFESVAPEALTADYWLETGELNDLQEITSKDIRYGSFKSFRTGKVFNNNRRTNDLGSNDYWESGAVNPQILLADMISILHPGLLPGHQLVYYKQLR